jgi:large subunit ribosomal protein L23
MDILIKPVITEKMTKDSELFNRFGFLVNVKANKIQIKNAIESAYGVSVNKVRHTKAGMISGRTNATKKAIVELAKGETIDVYGNI